MARDGFVRQVPRPSGPYCYMPEPPIINTESSKIRHFLGLVDLYIELRSAIKDDVFVIEPPVNAEYRPDIYTRLPHPVVIEYQRSRITEEQMQSKVDRFCVALERGEHDARVLWIASEAKQYKVKIPPGIIVAQFHPRLINDWILQNKQYKI
jgi:hypothetical protein